MTKERVAEIRAGIFMLVLLLGFATMVFIIGSRKGFFKSQITLKARFDNVYGLQVGAPVRFMGVGIGHVKAIILPKGLHLPKVDVLLQIDKSVQKNLSRDSIATIKWLSYVTGDSYVEIIAGEGKEPMVEDGDTILSAEPVNYTEVMAEGMNVIRSVSEFLEKLKEGRVAETLSEVSVLLKESLASFREGEGLLYSLIYDPKGKHLFENLNLITESLNRIMTELETGEGALHTLLYEPGTKETLINLASVAEKIDSLVTNFQEKEGLLYAIAFDPDKRQILDDLQNISHNLYKITEKITQGEGTIGALIADPSLYDAMKRLLSGTERSFILRTLIRRSIEHGKRMEAVE